MSNGNPHQPVGKLDDISPGFGAFVRVMEQKKLLDDISNLPSEAQRQVVDFTAVLKTRYK